MSFLIKQPYPGTNPHRNKTVAQAHLESLKKSYEAYRAYLESIKPHLTSSVYELATADWHYNPTNPKCPHDSRIEDIKIKEIGKRERGEPRKTQIEIILLGAYCDRLLKLTFFDVRSYQFDSSICLKGHGDWIVSEISLSQNRLVVYEVEFGFNAYLRIECKDITFEEQLISSSKNAVWSKKSTFIRG